MESRSISAAPASQSEKDELKEELIVGGIAGFLASGIAKVTVGFKEGMIESAIGGSINSLMSYGYRKMGFSMSASEALAFASTILIDIGGTHFFGSESPHVPIPYSEDQMVVHHTVFYTALALSLSGLYLYKKNNENGFFSQKIESQKAESQTTKQATIEEIQAHYTYGS